jgi:hypothetical protein
LGVHPAHLAGGVTEHRPAREVTVVTSWLRVVGAAVVLGAGTVVVPHGPGAAPLGTAVAHGAEETRVVARPSPDNADEDADEDEDENENDTSASPSPSASPSRAGSRPGEGRERPGRREAADEESRGAGPRERPGRDEAADEDADGGGRDADGATEPPDDGTGAPRPEGDGAASRAPGEAGTVPQAPASQEAVPVPGTSSRSAVPDPVAGGEPAVEPVLRILPLGSGLMLIGLGLGLAFVALRMRQGGGVP